VESADVFMGHSSFLLRCMIEEDDDGDVEWTKTNIFLHLRRQFKVRKTIFVLHYYMKRLLIHLILKITG
jgi:hypothetical protein